MKAMIFAAGLGTRLKPFTENHPKALAIVNKKTLLQRNIEYLKSYGINDFVINVHHYPEQIINFLEEHNYFNSTITISDETEYLLETGGGLKKASENLRNSTFLVMNVDILTNLNLAEFINFHQSNKALASLAVTERESSRYFLFNPKNELKGWKNVKTGESRIPGNDSPLRQKAFSGIHIIEPEIFKLMKQEGKFSMVDVYLELCTKQSILGFDHSKDILIDVGKPEAITKAEEYFN